MSDINININNDGVNSMNSGNSAPVIKAKTNHGLLKYIVLTFLTFGIYGIWEFSKISTDINYIASRHDNKKTMHFCLLSFVISWLTCGIGVFVWYHKLSNRIGDELKRRGISYHFSAGTFWLWFILGAFIGVGPFIYTHKLFKAMNLLGADYNARG